MSKPIKGSQDEKRINAKLEEKLRNGLNPTTDHSPSGMGSEDIKSIEKDLSRAFQSYAMSHPNMFFDRTKTGFSLEAEHFVLRLQAAAHKQLKAEKATPSTHDSSDRELRDKLIEHYDGHPDGLERWLDNMMQLIKADREAAALSEAKRYCDDGHYHDDERDLAMLPSERLAELESQRDGKS